MNIERAREIIADYRELLQFLPATQGPFDRDPTPREAMCHLHGMLDKMSEFLDECESFEAIRCSGDYQGAPDWDKFNTWLGFMQGVFWLHGDFTLNQMRNHNRPGNIVTFPGLPEGDVVSIWGRERCLPKKRTAP